MLANDLFHEYNNRLFAYDYIKKEKTTINTFL